MPIGYWLVASTVLALVDGDLGSPGVRAAITWVRANAARFDAGPGPLYLAGRSAGANLAIRVACADAAGIAGLICRSGYYVRVSTSPA
jgi:carboxylesterase type B